MPDAENPKRLLSTADVAFMWGRHPGSIRRLCQQDKLRFRRIGTQLFFDPDYIAAVGVENGHSRKHAKGEY